MVCKTVHLFLTFYFKIQTAWLNCFPELLRTRFSQTLTELCFVVLGVRSCFVFREIYGAVYVPRYNRWLTSKKLRGHETSPQAVSGLLSCLLSSGRHIDTVTFIAVHRARSFFHAATSQWACARCWRQFCVVMEGARRTRSPNPFLSATAVIWVSRFIFSSSF